MFGPVFRLEIVSGVRGSRVYVLRSLYGLGLLLVAASAYRGAYADGGMRSLPSSEVARFARQLFETLALAQGVAVVVLAPALAAGAVAGEAQRRSIDELLTTRLTAVEVVADKAAARLAQVAGLILAGLPILLVAAEFGGLGPWAALGPLGATLSTAFVLAGLALLASTLARSVRGALNATMTIGMAWLIVPGAVDVLLPRAGVTGQILDPWVAPVNAWVAASSPFAVWLGLVCGPARSAGDLVSTLAWMAAIQSVLGAACVGLAAALLRPAARIRAGGFRRAGRPPTRAASRAPVATTRCSGKS